jgi:hypothetical protein
MNELNRQMRSAVSMAHLVQSTVLVAQKKPEQAVGAAETAIALNRNLAPTYGPDAAFSQKWLGISRGCPAPGICTRSTVG